MKSDAPTPVRTITLTKDETRSRIAASQLEIDFDNILAAQLLEFARILSLSIST